MNKYLKILIFISLYLCIFNIAQAVGVGVKPSFLDLDATVKQAERVKIVVYNISQEAAIFKVYADELIDWIEIKPADFRLEANESKEVEIIVTALEDGKKATNLSVVAKPLDKKLFNADSGIKIPLRLDVSSAESLLSFKLIFWTIWSLASIILVALIIIFVLKLREKTWQERVKDKVEDIFHHKKHWWER